VNIDILFFVINSIGLSIEPLLKFIPRIQRNKKIIYILLIKRRFLIIIRPTLNPKNVFFIKILF